MAEALSNWLKDHEELKRLFGQYRSLTQQGPPAQQDPSTQDSIKRTVKEIITLLTQHQSAEDRTLYPMFGKVIPEEMGGKTLQSHAQLMDEVGRLQMDWLEKHGNPTNAMDWRLYHETAMHLINSTEDHIKDEEEVGLVYLRTHLSSEELTQLDQDYVEAKKTAPTHPHPGGPSAPLLSKVAHPVTGIIDRAADMIKEKLGLGGEPAGAPAGGPGGEHIPGTPPGTETSA